MNAVIKTDVIKLDSKTPISPSGTASETPTLWHDSFYRFVKVDDPEQLGKELVELCKTNNVLGSILLAHEGINAMLVGTEANLEQIRMFLEADERFAGMFYKRTLTKNMPFRRLRIKIKDEIVPLGLQSVDAVSKTGIDVSPADWRKLMQEDDVIVIDNRNDFEYQLGHFKGALNPEVRNFRDFTDYVENNLESWQDKKVAMYCTGGIRCEKTSAWMKDLGMDIYQLEGGIINYFEKMPNAEQDFEGECFVFDYRIALDTKLQETATTIDQVDELQYGKNYKRNKLR